MPLNLPTYQFNIQLNAKGNRVIFDLLRNKFVALTPEEWVRQHFVRFLIEEKHFPRGLMGNEISLIQNGIKRRCDTLVYNRNGSPLVIVEYKAPDVEISQRTFEQIVRYNMVLKALYLIVSNGITHYCCKIDYNNNNFLFLEQIPDYNEIYNEIGQ